MGNCGPGTLVTVRLKGRTIGPTTRLATEIRVSGRAAGKLDEGGGPQGLIGLS